MASSCPNPNNYEPLEEKDEEEEEENWLDLGLGLSHGCTKQKPRSSSGLAFGSSSSSSPRFQFQTQELGLGFDNESVRNSSGSLCVAPLSNHHAHVSSLTLLPSSSSWQWHMHSEGCLRHENLQIPLPNVHDYSQRQETGLWFNLCSSINQVGERLPQIPKAYIRVKDEKVTVFTVKTYLVRKLGLSNEAEIDISCLGQKLLHSQTLKYVRDAVWLPRLIDSINAVASMESPDGSSMNHLMSLHYERRFWD